MKNLKYLIPVALIFGGIMFIAATVFGATYFSSPRSASSTATSTLKYQTPGTATSTVIYDAYGVFGSNQTNTQSNTFATDEVALEIQFTASSTLSQLNVNFEYSEDLIDWYQDSSSNVYGYASSTLPVSLNQVPQYQWKFSSSTIGGAGASTTEGIGLNGSYNRDTRIIKFKPITRYTRAVITCAAGGLNCAYYATFIPRKIY